jgi:hypothetical protein
MIPSESETDATQNTMVDACCADIQGAADDLTRLQTLLTDAAGTLLGTFNAIEAYCQGEASQAAGADALAPHVRRAVAALQFEDLATQLLQHTRQRLSHLEINLKKFQILPSTLEGLDSALGASPYQGGAHPVRQEGMDTGSVDLF